MDDATIQERLAAELPRWTLEAGGITRRWRTGGWRATLMVVNAIAHLAEVAGHHPDLAVSYASITVALTTHDAGGVTEKDFALARKIEEVLSWQPWTEDPALLDGPARPAYLKYD